MCTDSVDVFVQLVEVETFRGIHMQRLGRELGPCKKGQQYMSGYQEKLLVWLWEGHTYPELSNKNKVKFVQCLCADLFCILEITFGKLIQKQFHTFSNKIIVQGNKYLSGLIKKSLYIDILQTLVLLEVWYVILRNEKNTCLLMF